MVFGGKAWVEGDRRRRVVGVVAWYFDNQGDSLFFKAAGLTPRGATVYELSIVLSALNCAPVTLLPSASIESDFKLRNAYLLNKGFGVATAPHYTVDLGQQSIAIIIYEVYVTTEHVSLNYHNYLLRLHRYNLITQLFAPAPVSVLF